MKLFPHPHKAENIRDQIQSIIQEYDIKYEQIFRVITDNGSNMVKTFKIEWIEDNQSEDIDYEPDFEKEINLEFDDIDEEINENEFDCEESELENEFKKVEIKRIPCVIHLLQCVISVCNKNSPFEGSLNVAIQLIKKFRQSGILAEKLKSESGSVLPTITPTRWNSLYLQISSLISKKFEISKICFENNIDNLSQTQWEIIQEYVNLYKPFNDITNQMSKDYETTISRVCSSILFLKHHMTAFSNKENEFTKTSAQMLLKELNKRFDPFLDLKHKNFFDGIYIASTFLDPRFARILSVEQTNYAKSFLKEYSKGFDGESVTREETQSSFTTPTEKSEFEAFMETKFSQIPSSAVNIMIDLDKQLLNWIHFIGKTRISLNTEPLDFWRNDTSTQEFNGLKNIALNILCTPSSTSTVERVFSAAGNACIGRKNRLSEKRLEMIVFFKNNAKFLNTLNFLQ